MDWNKILIFLLPAIVLMLAALASWLPGYLRLRKRGTVHVIEVAAGTAQKQHARKQGAELVWSVATNNSHTELTNVFSDLLAGLEEQGVELNINLKGYVAND